MTQTLDHVQSVLADAVVDDARSGIFRANRRIFTDPEIFELEMKHIFEGNWIYLAHESQLPKAGDYFTSGDLAYQLQEILRTTEALLKKSRRIKS